VSSYAGFMPRRVLQLKFKGNRLVEWPRRRWFCQLLEDEVGKELVRNSKNWWLFVHERPQNCSVLEEEEEDM
jgi:hypothetical protein